MQIGSRITGIVRELLLNGGTGDVTSRQRSGTSDPSGDATRIQVPRNNAGNIGSDRARVSRNSSENTVDLKVAVEKLNELIRDHQQDVAFSVDKEANTTVIKFFKTTTGELIKQYPPEEILAMKAKLRKLTGWLVDKHV